MQHHEHAGPLEVDHFNPRLKTKIIQDYDNLFPASRHCNGKKSDNWPTSEEQKAGCRFLNPCQEMDYGEQIYEDTATNRLVGVTPAARWHIRMCGLNAEHLIHERAKRARGWALLNRQAVLVKRDAEIVLELVEALRSEVELMIPEIPAPPDT